MKHIATTVLGPVLGAVLVLIAGACSATQDTTPAPAPEQAAGGHKAITTDKLEPYECGSITRMHTFGGVFLASQPKPADFEQAKNGGVKTVVNLRPESEIKDFDEPAVVAKLGLKYVNVPFGSPAQMSDAVLDRARDVLNTAERPILMHCSSANRAGAVWLVWRALDGGLAVDDAVAEAKVVGLASPELEGMARAYVARKSTERR